MATFTSFPLAQRVNKTTKLPEPLEVTGKITEKILYFPLENVRGIYVNINGFAIIGIFFYETSIDEEFFDRVSDLEAEVISHFDGCTIDFRIRGDSRGSDLEDVPEGVWIYRRTD